MFTVVFTDDYGHADIVGKFDIFNDALAFAQDYDNKYICDPYADGCIIFNDKNQSYDGDGKWSDWPNWYYDLCL
jgi:hypothetical protein